MLVMKRGRNPAPGAPRFGCSGPGVGRAPAWRRRGEMWLEGQVHEQDRKMLQNNAKGEVKGKGLVPCTVGGGRVAMPREQPPCPEQEGGEGTTAGNWQGSATWTRPPAQEKNITESLQICNVRLGVLRPVSCLQALTHCFLG